MSATPLGSRAHPLKPTLTVARRIREARVFKGWSAQRLSDALREVGMPWDRSIVANLESGRRAGVSVDELLALAVALDVAPIHLLVPLSNELYEVAPGMAIDSGAARAWIRGTLPLAATDPRMFYSQVPIEELHLLRTEQVQG